MLATAQTAKIPWVPAIIYYYSSSCIMRVIKQHVMGRGGEGREGGQRGAAQSLVTWKQARSSNETGGKYDS